MSRKTYILPIACFASIFLGIGYGSVHWVERSVYDGWVGRISYVKGRVKEDPSVSSSGSISVQIDSVKLGNISTPGFVIVGVRSLGGAKRGDYIEGWGVIKDGFGNFPVSITMQSIAKVERPIPGDVGRVVRDWFGEKVRLVLPEPQASLGIGFLTGQKTALPPDLSASLKVAGLTHIVVASGYNLTILVRLARKLFSKVSKYLSALSSAVMIIAFMGVTGLSPSMTRAGLVSGMSLFSWYYGHGFHPLVLLPIAAAITTAFQPSYVWGDLGWQLSFAAFAGVMIVAPLMQSYFFGEKEPGIFRQILGETIAAHLVTIPIIALSFGTVSNVAIIANLLVVPLVPFAMLLTFACGILSILSFPFVGIIAVPTSWLLGYMTNVATFVSELSWAQSSLAIEPIIWVCYALLVAGISLWMWRAAKHNFRGSNVAM